MPHHRRRTTALLIAAVTLTSLLAGCKQESPPPGNAGPTVSTELSASPSAAAPSPSKAPPVAAAPTCAQVRNAMVRGVLDPYYAFGADGAPLAEGAFSGEDGLVLAVQQPCATGELGADVGNVTVGTIMSSIVDTTGRYWGLMLCTRGTSRAQCVVHVILDDRDPIESLAITDRKLTVVYLTRGSGEGMAGVSIRRTAVYTAVGASIREQSRTDAPYTP
jgi:hypothetical protein